MDERLTVSFRGSQFNALQVSWFLEENRASRVAQVRVRAVLPAVLGLDALLGTEAELRVTTTKKTTRIFRGLIGEVSLLATPRQDETSRISPTYEFLVRSSLSILERSVDCRIFQEQTTQEIVTSVLATHGLDAKCCFWDLDAEYEAREYCTQYQESALHFISRLLEEEGIYFFSTVDEEGLELIVFSDDSSAATPSPETSLESKEGASQNAEEDAVYGLSVEAEIQTGRMTMNSFDFRRPNLSLEKSASADRFSDLESYQTTEFFTSEAVSQRRAQLRLEELTAQVQLREAATDSPLVATGRMLKIKDASGETSLFVVATRTEFDVAADDDGGAQFLTTATVLPKAVFFRPPRIHEKPKIRGPQTATVVAPADSDAESVHTDEFGRVKVRFHWDRYAAADASASCWMRVAQMQTSGSMVLPRVHWEVVVEFFEGDPDRPLVTGKLYNGQFMPPYELPAGKTRTSLQTSSSPNGGGKNEIRFEDAAGAEEVMIHSQYNTNLIAANNRKKNITRNETIFVGNNATVEIGGNQTMAISKGYQTTITGDRSLEVSGNRKAEVNAVYGLTVQGTSGTTIGGNWTTMVGSPLDALISLGTAKAAAVVGAQAEKAFAEVSGAVQGALDQAAGPILDLTEKANAIGANMARVADGQLAATGAVLGGAVALPTASDFGRSLAQGPAFANQADGTESSAGQISFGGAVNAAVAGGLSKVAKELKTAALGSAESSGGGTAGGTSVANVGGPDGELTGSNEEDTTTGSGLAQYKITGTHDENVGGSRFTASLEPVNTNVTLGKTEDISAALIETIAKDWAESVEGASTESQPSLVVVAKGGEVETVHGARQLNIGGALKETIKGDYSIEAGEALNMVAGSLELKAGTKLTIQCGASSLVVDGSGVTITSPMVSISGSKLHAKKSVSDG